MLRTFLVQNFFTISDEGTEDALHDVLSIRKFVGITINDHDIPDASTICRFRNLLINNEIHQQLFDQVVSSLAAKGLVVKKGTIVDSTIIECSTSKRNKAKATDCDASWTKKAGNYKHGYKSHIGADADSGIITSNKTTTAKTHDATVANDLLHGGEQAVYGDSGYLGAENRKNALSAKKYKIMRRPSTIAKLPEDEQAKARQRQQAIAAKRAKVEHRFATIKRLFGFKRTLYRGLKKNAAKLNIMCALANIWTISRQACPQTA